ncbi:MAG: RNA polymerase sigma factor [Verrucomicrobia bacterium]|nr:RNA polymerase sigma factor [Verrucomicrobiota bacterium]
MLLLDENLPASQRQLLRETAVLKVRRGVAAEVTRLTSIFDCWLPIVSNEPPYVGCYIGPAPSERALKAGKPPDDDMGEAKPQPNLTALRKGDADAWDTAFDWLWPTAFAVARTKLQEYLPAEVEDVAIETLEALVEKTAGVAKVEELKPLAAGIAHNLAVSRLRERFAAKRGAGKTESLEAKQEADGGDCEAAAGETLLAELDQAELAGLLGELQRDLPTQQRAVVADFFLEGLSYEQIATKQGLAIGSVGVYLKRGLEAIRRQGAKHPKLLKELEAFLR